MPAPIGDATREDISDPEMAPGRKWWAIPQITSQTLQTWIAILSALGIAAYLCMRFLLHAPAARSEIPLYMVVALGGLPLLWGLARRLLHLEFG